MDVYGLTGGIGAGKSAVADMLEEYGIPVVSADELSRIVVARGGDGLREVVGAFGADVLDDAGELDRRKMAELVFRDPARRRQLETILHPRIRERYEQVLDALEKAGHEVAVYEVPLLFEKNLQADMKGVILVSATENNRIARVRARDDATTDEVRARMAAQMDEAAKRKKANYIIDNDGDLDDLRREVEILLSRYLKIPESPRRPTEDSTPGRPVPQSRQPTDPPAGTDGNKPPPPPERKREAGVKPAVVMPPATPGSPPSKVRTQVPAGSKPRPQAPAPKKPPSRKTTQPPEPEGGVQPPSRRSTEHPTGKPKPPPPAPPEPPSRVKTEHGDGAGKPPPRSDKPPRS